MMKKRWTEKEINDLIKYYPKYKKSYVEEIFLYRSWKSLIHKASQLGIRRTSNSKAHVWKLLEESNEAYYWMGFLLADGYFDHKKKCLKFCLSSKDKSQFYKFTDFIENQNSYNIYEINNDNAFPSSYTRMYFNVVSKEYVPKIIKKFKINACKTKNPPNDLDISNDNFFLSLFIGFIDGDGSILKHHNFVSIRMECLNTWKYLLQKWIDRIYRMKPPTLYNKTIKSKKNILDINSKNSCVLSITNSEIILWLKNKILELNLPVLERKWDRIDSNYINPKFKKI